jgi:hypothetical protein
MPVCASTSTLRHTITCLQVPFVPDVVNLSPDPPVIGNDVSFAIQGKAGMLRDEDARPNISDSIACAVYSQAGYFLSRCWILQIMMLITTSFSPSAAF